jgi:ABC-type Fe3+-hydroxamate transport system substrate-binding protein
MIELNDQTGREIKLNEPPLRIISVVPSITELLFHLGLREEVIAITKFCVHPKEWFKTKTKIGGTKNLNIEKIKILKPQFVIANKEENVQEQIIALQNICPVYVSDIKTLDDALLMIYHVGLLGNKQEKAIALCEEIRKRFERMPALQIPIKVCYLIWKKPYMTIGGDTFISDMLTRCGFINVFAGSRRYPQVSLQQIIDTRCEMLLLSSEPFPFTEKHIDEIRSGIAGIAPGYSLKIQMVDGEMFSWYGSRILKAVEYTRQLIISF